MIIEIVILAMIAAFLGLRLYSVLGRRSEHEEEVIPHRFERGDTPPPADNPPRQLRQPVVLRGVDDSRAPANEAGVRAIASSTATRSGSGPFLFVLFFGLFFSSLSSVASCLCCRRQYERYSVLVPVVRDHVALRIALGDVGPPSPRV